MPLGTACESDQTYHRHGTESRKMNLPVSSQLEFQSNWKDLHLVQLVLVMQLSHAILRFYSSNIVSFNLLCNAYFICYISSFAMHNLLTLVPIPPPAVTHIKLQPRFGVINPVSQINSN